MENHNPRGLKRRSRPRRHPYATFSSASLGPRQRAICTAGRVLEERLLFPTLSALLVNICRLLQLAGDELNNCWGDASSTRNLPDPSSSPPNTAAPGKAAEVPVPRPEARRPSRDRSPYWYTMNSTRRAMTSITARLLRLHRSSQDRWRLLWCVMTWRQASPNGLGRPGDLFPRRVGALSPGVLGRHEHVAGPDKALAVPASRVGDAT